MRLDITRQPLSITILLSFLLLACFWSSYGLCPPPEALYAAPESMPLGAVVESLVAHIPWLGYVITTLFLFTNAMLITQIASRNMLYITRSYLPCVLYLAAACGIIMPAASLGATIAAYLVLKGFEYLSLSFSRTANFDCLFRGALVIGLAVLFHVPAIVYLLLVLIALLHFQRSGREALVALVGMALPIVVCGYIYWSMGEGFTHIFTKIYDIVRTSDGFRLFDPHSGISRIVIMGLWALLLLMAIGSFATMARNMRTRARKIQQFAIWFLVIAVGMLVLPCNSAGDLPLVAIGVALVAPTFFARYTGIFPPLFYLLLLLASIVRGFLPF